MAVPEFALSVPWLRCHLPSRQGMTRITSPVWDDQEMIMRCVNLSDVVWESRKGSFIFDKSQHWGSDWDTEASLRTPRLELPRGHSYWLQLRAVLMEGASPCNWPKMLWIISWGWYWGHLRTLILSHLRTPPNGVTYAPWFWVTRAPWPQKVNTLPWKQPFRV